MEKVRPWCGQRWDRGRLKNRTVAHNVTFLHGRCYFTSRCTVRCLHSTTVLALELFPTHRAVPQQRHRRRGAAGVVCGRLHLSCVVGARDGRRLHAELISRAITALMH